MVNVIPKVSVLMPVYNGAIYLREAVESILNQTFTDFEFLIIDDGSTDASLQILQSYAAHDARIRLISRPNQGVTKTLNQMLQLARGELIARMDADDIAMPDRLMRQVELLQQQPQVVCVGGAHELIDDRGRVLIFCPVPETDAAIQASLLGGTSPICHPCATMRRSAVLAVGGYDETLLTSQDLDLFLKLGEVGQLANVGAGILRYRFHGESVGSRKAEQQHQDARIACERAWQRRQITGQFTRKTWLSKTDRPSRYAFLLRCGWSLFQQGDRQSALGYGMRAIQTLPNQLEGWKLLICALVKPLPPVMP